MNLQAQSQENFSLGRHATGFSFLDTIYRERRDPGHAGQLCFTYHLRFAELSDVVSIHGPRPLQARRSTVRNCDSQLLKSMKLILIIINYAGLLPVRKQDRCHAVAQSLFVDFSIATHVG
jgi:hypothetical protein